MRKEGEDTHIRPTQNVGSVKRNKGKMKGSH